MRDDCPSAWSASWVLLVIGAPMWLAIVVLIMLVSAPGIPMAERAYTRTPLKGVTTPQYFIEALARGI